ncbi:hypothetical protein BHE74_00035057 [Ensete ventricosum]|nr:hypothetical protein BHE74_00035057 [Ensete ventricosum]
MIDQRGARSPCIKSMPSFAIYRPSASEVDDAQPAIEERKRKRKQQQLDDLTNQVAQLENQNVQIEMQISLQRRQSTTMEVENAILRAQLHELTQRLQSLTPVLGITEEIGVMAMGKPETPARLLRPRQLPYSERPILAATASLLTLLHLEVFLVLVGAALLGLRAVVTVVLEGVIGVELVPDVAGRGAQLLSLVPRCDALSPLAASFAFLMLSATCDEDHLAGAHSAAVDPWKEPQVRPLWLGELDLHRDDPHRPSSLSWLVLV